MNSTASRGKIFASYAIWICVAFVIINFVAGAATGNGEFVGKAVGMLFGAPVLCGIAYLVGYLSGSKPENSNPSTASAPVREPISDRPSTDSSRQNQAVSTPASARVFTPPEVIKAAMPTNPIPSQPGTIQSITTIDEDAIYEIVGNEIDQSRVEKGLWTRLFAEMDGDETKVKVAYIKRRAEKLIAAEHARIQEETRVEAEEQEAARIANAKLQAMASSAGVTSEQAKEMLEFSITREGDKFLFDVYRYDRLEDAVNYAKTRCVTAREEEDASLSAKIKQDMIVAAANGVLQNPTIENSLKFLGLKEDVTYCQGLFKTTYQIKVDGKMIDMPEHEVIAHARNLAWAMS